MYMSGLEAVVSSLAPEVNVSPCSAVTVADPSILMSDARQKDHRDIHMLS